MGIRSIAAIAIFLAVVSPHLASAQEKKLERIRVGGGATSATQMSMWLAKEGNLYEKHGLSVEAISIPGSSLALQAMLAGELPIIQECSTGNRFSSIRRKYAGESFSFTIPV